MLSRKSLTLFAAALLMSGVAMFVTVRRHSHEKSFRGQGAKEASLPTREPELRNYVSKNATSKSPEVQDMVGAARIRLGYAAAGQKDWSGARSMFLTTVREYKGTGKMSADFGGVPDQAAYQAAVCLAADHKVAEARSEFVRFIEERPESPLVHAAYKRLVRMNGGRSTDEYDHLLQQSVSKQETTIRFELSVCGPKTIEYLLKKRALVSLQGAPIDYKTIAKLCDTTDQGTTMKGMRKGLKALGVESYSYKLNRQDFARTKMPAILLMGDHYVALLNVNDSTATIYDTRLRAEKPMKLPALDDPDFAVPAILFTKPEAHKP